MDEEGTHDVEVMEGLMDMTNVLLFKDKVVEGEFSVNLSRQSRKKMRAAFKIMGFVFTVIVGQVLMSRFYLALYMLPCVVMTIVSFIGWKLTFKDIWVTTKGFSENFSLIYFCVLALTLGLSLTMATWVKSDDGVECKLYPVDDGEMDMRTATVQFYGFSQALWPCLMLQLALTSNVIRYVKFRFLIFFALATHFLRSLVIEPVSPELTPLWAICSYVVLPSVIWVSAKNHEIHGRELFLYQRKLSQDNIHLTAQLEAAEKALAFEKPTEQERCAVLNVFGDGSGDESSDLKQFAVRFEDLEFHERVGAGAFGEVIKATYCGTVCVAKRLLRNKVDEANAILLRDEVRLLSKLRHPNIVQFLGVSWDSIANLCILFEYVPQGDLTSVLRDPALSLTWEDPKLRMAIDVAQGLAYLHGRDPVVLHRDMKPDNVLVTNTFSCKITDFGSSRSSKNSSTMTMVGTAVYMAPEVYLGEAYSSEVDVYSFGLTLWEMHTHTRPFEELNWGPERVLRMTAVNGVRPKFDKGAPPQLQDLVVRCWAADPRDRPSMVTVVQELCQLLVSELASSKVVEIERVRPPTVVLDPSSKRATTTTEEEEAVAPTTTSASGITEVAVVPPSTRITAAGVEVPSPPTLYLK